jgi:hypothetical protein
LFLYFIVSSHGVQENVRSMFLQETGELTVQIAPWNEQEVYTSIGKLFRSRKFK